MSFSKLITRFTDCNWLSGLALWIAVGAWGACGVYGWTMTTAGVMTPITIALTIGAMVFAARSLANAATAEGIVRRIALVALGALCIIQTAYSGHQGLMVSEAQRWAAYERYETVAAANAKIDASIAALPPVPLSDAAGRPIGPARTKELGAQRSNEVARLTGLKTQVTAVAAPATRMSADLAWAVTGLIEALGLFGFFAIGRRSPAVAASNAASELAKRRWKMA